MGAGGGQGWEPHRAVAILLTLALAFCGPWNASAGATETSDDARALLLKMADAMRSLDYQGAFTYQHGGRIDTLKVFHAGGRNERERLVNLNGPRSEVIRNGRTITCVQADGSAVVYASRAGRGLLPLVPDAGKSGPGDRYSIHHAGTDRVAGFVADVIDITPQDGFRYGYRLWLDRDSRLLLRSMVLDAEQRMLEQFMFVSVQIGTAPSEDDLLPSRQELTTTRSGVENEVPIRGQPGWQVGQLPKGFALASAQRSVAAGRHAEHLVYSDGLASVSVYIEPREGPGSGRTTMAGRGTLNIYTFEDEHWRYTVLGDVPVATVTAMAQSLRQSRSAAAISP